MNNWLEVWMSNYVETSEIAQTVMSHSKQTYKGDTYLPWALLVGALYQLDENAKIEKCMNDRGGFVFTDEIEIKTVKENVTKDGKDSVLAVQTVVSHFVKVKVFFMGKEFEEAYPIQDNDYSASKVYDQNKVNKAQQRCLARVISLATGIGWRLYENTEAQFESDKAPEPVKPMVKASAKKEEPRADQTIAKIEDTPTGNMAVEVASLIVKNKDNPALVTLINNYNEVLKKKYVDASGSPLELNLEDSLQSLIDKVSVIDNPEKMLKGLKKAIGE